MDLSYDGQQKGDVLQGRTYFAHALSFTGFCKQGLDRRVIQNKLLVSGEIMKEVSDYGVVSTADID